ncbi:MAG: TfoX/Sxy family protein [Phyllobacterium sp.]
MDNGDILDMFSSLGAVNIKRMFGGKGIYYSGLIIALEVDDEILLKADEQSRADFVEAGCRQWTYQGKSRPVHMPYWSVPNEALDDPDTMEKWARLAYEAALRGRNSKASRRPEKVRR